MLSMDDKTYYYDMLRSVRTKRISMPVGSHVRHALSEDMLATVERHFAETVPADLRFGYLPPVLGLIQSRTDEELARLDEDIDLVLAATEKQRHQQVVQFLQSGAHDQPGLWYGGLFDIWAKATALRSVGSTTLDHVLPNGRDHDICLRLGGRTLHLENTVITQDDEARDVWDRFLIDKKLDPDKVLFRPGAYCPPNAKGPSPYYDALRVYAKVYDKLAKHLDPTRTQCVADEPNVLLISFAGIGVRAVSPSVGWALDELFADQPRAARTIVGDGLTDISLEAWIQFTVNDLMAKGKMTVDSYCNNSNKILSAPRKLSGVLLFDDCQLVSSRVNYNALEACRMSHREMVELEALFGNRAPYWLSGNEYLSRVANV